jgi:hypothetical protein
MRQAARSSLNRIASKVLAGRRMASPKPKPRKLVYCSFCGKEQAEVKKIIAGPGVQICESCVNVCKTIIDRELVADAFKPVGMTHAQFKVGQEFLTETGRWICTDKGKRTVIAKQVAGRGGVVPPLAVTEIEVVFDEIRLRRCSPVPSKPVAKKSRR